jgi:hypothetical protein
MENKNIVAVVGTYTKDGQEKKIYRTVGKLMQGDKGPYIRLDACFNPAGVPRKDGSDSIVLGIYEQKDGNTDEKATAPSTPKAAAGMDDDIPF